MRPSIRSLLILIAFLASVAAAPLQGGTPPPPQPTPTPPWWQIPQQSVPYVVILLIGAFMFILGGLARPMIGNLEEMRCCNGCRDGGSTGIFANAI